MIVVYNDGGRANAGFRGDTRDCACRAIAIATGTNYKIVYDNLIEWSKDERPSKRRRGVSHPRTGMHGHTIRKYMLALGWKWTPTMFIGSGCKVHLKAEELPKGILICSVSKHYTTVIDGEIHDTDDPSRGERRCVYGYFQKA